MQNKTLLSVVQSALTATGGDAVSSISESTESEDMAVIAEDVFYNIIHWDEWPHLNRLATVASPADPTTNPVVLRIKDDFKFIHKVQYMEEENEERQGFTTIKFMEPEFFIDHCDYNINHNDTMDVTGYGVDPSTFVTIHTDRHPSFFTTFDNEHLIFDSYNSDEEAFISNYKSRVMAQVVPDFQLDDSYVIDLPNNMMGLYMSQIKVAAYYYLNQVNNPLDGNNSLRHMAKLRNYKERIVDDKAEHYPQGSYARRPNGSNDNKLGRR